MVPAGWQCNAPPPPHSDRQLAVLTDLLCLCLRVWLGLLGAGPSVACVLRGCQNFLLKAECHALPGWTVVCWPVHLLRGTQDASSAGCSVWCVMCNVWEGQWPLRLYGRGSGPPWFTQQTLAPCSLLVSLGSQAFSSLAQATGGQRLPFREWIVEARRRVLPSDGDLRLPSQENADALGT